MVGWRGTVSITVFVLAHEDEDMQIIRTEDDWDMSDEK
jgi:hypothetical protein